MQTENQNLFVEQAVLAGIIIDGSNWDNVADKLTVNHFTIDAHQRIFKALSGLALKGKPIDVITVADELETSGQWIDTQNGALYYVGSIAKESTGSANILHYVDLLIRDETKRRLQNAAMQISRLPGENIETSEMIDKAESMLFAIQQSKVRGSGPQMMSNVLASFITSLEENPMAKTLATGFKDIDELLDGGVRAGELIVLAGRPGSGKTTLGMCVAQHVACKLDKEILVFSMEMKAEALASRMVSSLGMIEAHKLRTGKLEEHDWSRLTGVIGLLSKNTIYIDDTPNLKPSELRARARRIKRQVPGLSLIVVDYLQLMSSDTKYENRVNEIGECSGALKSLAKELDIPVIALAQLNRNSVKGGEIKKPTMADLRDSGSIEQDSDVVGLIYHNEVDGNKTGTAQIIIDKQRSGKTGEITLTFEGRFNRFHDYTGPAVNVVPMISYAKTKAISHQY